MNQLLYIWFSVTVSKTLMLAGLKTCLSSLVRLKYKKLLDQQIWVVLCSCTTFYLKIISYTDNIRPHVKITSYKKFTSHPAETF